MFESTENTISFSTYTSTLRKQRGLSLEKLSEGLCNPTILASWESGRRTPDILMQDRILNRLGAPIDTLYFLIGKDKYEQWYMRTQVLCSIRDEQYEIARQQLNHYMSQTDLSIPLEKQFCLRVKSMILSQTHANKSDIHKVINNALKITVPQIDQKPLHTLVLSVQELDMILDRNLYSCTPNLRIYEEVISYASQNRFEQMVQIKILPKAVVLFCQGVEATGQPLTTDDYKRQIILLDMVLNLMRTEHCMYYLWEILTFRDKAFQKIQSTQSANPNLHILSEKNREWLNTLTSLYHTYHIRKETIESTNVYLIRRVECINDVIRTRREMLGFTPQELCDGICSFRTMQRIESGMTTPQQFIVDSFFNQLRLPQMGLRNELFISNYNTSTSLNALRKSIIEGNLAKMDLALLSIKQNLSNNNQYNLQYLQSAEAYSLWTKGIYSNEEFCLKMRDILALTIPWECILNSSIQYFTNNELTYFHYIILGTNPSSPEYAQYHTILENYFFANFDDTLRVTHSSLYNFLLDILQNYWGNIGEFQKSNAYNLLGIKECLHKKHLGSLIHFHYATWWNDQQEQKKAHPDASISLEKVKECAILADLFGYTSERYFYLKKINHND